MKMAKEKFKELGYMQFLKSDNDNFEIYYVERGNMEDYKRKRIAFFADKKILCTKAISVAELKAINQQCKELGWLDESK